MNGENCASAAGDDSHSCAPRPLIHGLDQYLFSGRAKLPFAAPCRRRVPGDAASRPQPDSQRVHDFLDWDARANNGDRPQLLRNDGGNHSHWIEIRLIGTRSNRDGIGAKVKVVAHGIVQTDEAKGGMSYQAAHDPRLHFGLGKATTITVLDVAWPSGAVTKLTDVAADRATLQHLLNCAEFLGWREHVAEPLGLQAWPTSTLGQSGFISPSTRHRNGIQPNSRMNGPSIVVA